MTLVVRADAGDALGTGHVMRSRSVASRLGLEQGDAVLVTASIPASLRSTTASWGWTVCEIGHLSPKDDAAATIEVVSQLGSCDAILVDHYGLDAVWEQHIRPWASLHVVVDDLADRAHAADLLIDPSIDAKDQDWPSRLNGDECILLLGPRYAPLAPAYDDITPRVRDGHVRELLIFLGGGTGAEELVPVIDSIEASDFGIQRATIVLGHAFVDRAAVHARAVSSSTCIVMDHVDSMLPLLQQADLAIGASGGAQWERCATGLPTLTVLTHPNQSRDCVAFESAGATRHLGALNDMRSTGWSAALARACEAPAELRAMGVAAAALVSGRQQAWESARLQIASLRSKVESGGDP